MRGMVGMDATGTKRVLPRYTANNVQGQETARCVQMANGGIEI